jgi:hypothetical protein
VPSLSHFILFHSCFYLRKSQFKHQRIHCMPLGSCFGSAFSFFSRKPKRPVSRAACLADPEYPAYPPLPTPSPFLARAELALYRTASRADNLLRVCLSTSPTPTLVANFERECIEIEDLVKGECADAAREQLTKTDYLAFERFMQRTLQLIQIWLKGGEGASAGLFKPLILDPHEIFNRAQYFREHFSESKARTYDVVEAKTVMLHAIV